MPSIVIKPIINYNFKQLPFSNSDKSYIAVSIKNCAVETIVPTTANKNTKQVVIFKKGSTFQIPPDKAFDGSDMFCVEMLINPSSSTSIKSKLSESQFLPFAFSLEKKSNRFYLKASVHCVNKRWYSCNSDSQLSNSIPINRWTKVAFVFTGDDILLIKDNIVVGRRAIKNASLKPVGDKGIYIGTWIDGRRDQYIGKLAQLKIYNGIPKHYESITNQAIRFGVGDIESKYLDIGGGRSFLGAKIGAERANGQNRFQIYKNGRIYWTPEYGAFEVHGAILNRYLKAGVQVKLGYPKSDEIRGGRNSRVSYFDNGAIYWSASTGAHEITGESYAHYVSLGSHKSSLGLPISGIAAIPGGNRTVLKGATIYWSKRAGAHEVHGSIRARYDSLRATRGLLGFPTTDELRVKKGSRVIGRVSRFTGGAIYWSGRTGAFEIHGPIQKKYEELGGATGKLGFPLSNETKVNGTNITYNDFQNGIIVYRSGWTEARPITELLLKLSKAKSSNIDDGRNWYGTKDKSAELYTLTTIKYNNKVLENRRKSGNKKTTAILNINKSFTKINSKSRIDLQIEYWDYDKSSGNDRLGRLNKRFELRNCFGLTHEFDNKVVANEPMTSKSGDSPRINTCRLEYSMNNHREIDKNLPFREQCWWRFDNFKGSSTLSRQMMADTFKDVDSTSDSFWNKYIENPLDSLFYSLAYKSMADGGNCFGMSSEAARAMANNSVFLQPLHESYKSIGDKKSIEQHTELPSNYRNIINSAQSTQLGGEVYNVMIDNILNAAVLRPRRVFNDVKRYINTGNLPIITLQDLETGRGHAVLAYSYKTGRGSQPDEIFIADPNTVWREVSKTQGREKKDRILIFKNNTFQTVFAAGDTYKTSQSDVVGISLPSTFMFAVPYSAYGGQQRSLIFDVLIDIAQVIATLVILFGDAEVEQITSGSRKLFGTKNGKRIMNIGSSGIHNFVQMPTFDVRNGLELFAKKGKGNLNIDTIIKGRKTGKYEFNTFNNLNSVNLKTNTIRNAKDIIKLENSYTQSPEIRFKALQETKKVKIELGYVHDLKGRVSRSYELSLQAERSNEVAASIAKYGDGILIENAGRRNPFNIKMKVMDRGQLKEKTMRINPDNFPGSKVIQIRNTDLLNPESTIIMEGLTSIVNGSLINRIIKPGL